MHKSFPDSGLARSLLPHAFDHRDGAHDEAHLLRVWRNVEKIMAREGGDRDILLAATLLHDCVRVDKASPERRHASRFAAEKADEVLSALGWEAGKIKQVFHAIEAHSYSAGLEPVSIEAKILQDADGLDAIGFIGVARCMYLAGMRGAARYQTTDPGAVSRPLDDTAFALDHFQTKLLTLADGFRTQTGRGHGTLGQPARLLYRAAGRGLLRTLRAVAATATGPGGAGSHVDGAVSRALPLQRQRTPQRPHLSHR
ncbi:HD domain-containing protein [Pseudogemmobacter sonorensis]|uniref:HD domain-containing protein n=1 Tax=Pseudogemmobacter sonorensis TaxID=2989681 RepID=UPI003682ED32